MVSQQEVGDGYIRFRESTTSKVVAEVYALSQKDTWRSRVPGHPDADLDSREEAIAHTLKLLG